MYSLNKSGPIFTFAKRGVSPHPHTPLACEKVDDQRTVHV